MSDEKKEVEGSLEDESSSKESTPDIKNVQAEFYRKTDKLMQENQRLSEQLAQITNMIQQSKPAASAVEEDLEDLAFRDPKAYAKKVTEKAVKQADEIFDRKMQQYQQSNATIAQLANDYPELNQSDADLTKRSIEIYRSLSPQEQSSSLAYKSAVREAAAELGILPKSKRSGSGSRKDDFALSGGSNSGSGNSKQSNSNKDLSESTLAFAEAVGLNINDKKILERIKQRSQRKSWSKYE
jgi:hypothetical protein